MNFKTKIPLCRGVQLKPMETRPVISEGFGPGNPNLTVLLFSGALNVNSHSFSGGPLPVNLQNQDSEVYVTLPLKQNDVKYVLILLPQT